MWTTAGIFSFATYGLTRLATNPTYAWRVKEIVLADSKQSFVLFYFSRLG